MGPLLASGSSDTTVLLHDLREFADESQPSIKLVHDGSISGISFWTVDDRTVLITASADTTIRCWDVEEVLASASDAAYSEGVSALAVGTLSNEPFIAGGGADGHIPSW
jgi:WD40 repeat protein